MNKLHKILFTFIVGSIGGLLFSIIGIPVPWLLGPLTFLLIGSSLKPDLFYWPKTYKSVGMVLIGYTIGLALDGDPVKEIGRQLPYMFGMTMLLILLSAGIAWIVAKISKINYATALLSSIPGGMTQVMVMAEET
ncbi:MAG: AbrB family transcriptional regulator, partial [Kurthia sp.]